MLWDLSSRPSGLAVVAGAALRLALQAQAAKPAAAQAGRWRSRAAKPRDQTHRRRPSGSAGHVRRRDDDAGRAAERRQEPRAHRPGSGGDGSSTRRSGRRRTTRRSRAIARRRRSAARRTQPKTVSRVPRARRRRRRRRLQQLLARRRHARDPRRWPAAQLAGHRSAGRPDAEDEAGSAAAQRGVRSPAAPWRPTRAKAATSGPPGAFDGPELRPLAERCLLGFGSRRARRRCRTTSTTT